MGWFDPLSRNTFITALEAEKEVQSLQRSPSNAVLRLEWEERHVFGELGVKAFVYELAFSANGII